MRYQRMTIQEYALYQRSLGLKVEKRNDLWWAEVRPFFFRPLIPLAEVDPEATRYPGQSRIGGYLHAVPPAATANAQMNFFIYDNLQRYSLDQLKAKHRHITRKGIRNFEARRLPDAGTFIDGAYEIYRSFYARTRYQYKKERLDRACFIDWSEKLFGDDRVLVVGAYRMGKLAAIDVSCQVEGLIIDEIFFSDKESLDLKVTDFLLHTIREIAVSSDADYVFRGLPSGHRTLDESKLTRGCKVVRKPALLWINPLARYTAKLFMKKCYNKLLGITSFSPEKVRLREPQ
ncbi:MAG: hypothetical protein EG828_08580 [Deltaproteobacteria bacterium]|nr:hypothetical protein [Deltaproteobacteria bacterium]